MDKWVRDWEATWPPAYCYSARDTASANLVRANSWIGDRRWPSTSDTGRLLVALDAAMEALPFPAKTLVRDRLYGQLLVQAVAEWATLQREREALYEEALTLLRKWRRRWAATDDGVDLEDPGHQLALVEWAQLRKK